MAGLAAGGMEACLGRGGVVGNLRKHLLQGRSAVVAGGPRMGKSTFLRQMAAALPPEAAVVSFDLSKKKPADFRERLPDGSDPVVVLMDCCESLLPHPNLFLDRIIPILTDLGNGLRGIVWAGSVAWGEWAMTHRDVFGASLRYYPLVVLPPKEARPVLKSRLRDSVTVSELEDLLEKTGGHPHLLAETAKRGNAELDAFFEQLWKAADRTEERAVLTRLIEAGQWVSLERLKDDGGKGPPKEVLDRLAILGLINRTIVDGAAAVRIVSPVLTEWVRRTHRVPSGI